MQSSDFSKSISRVSWLEGQPASEAERSKSLGCEAEGRGFNPHPGREAFRDIWPTSQVENLPTG